VIHNNDKDSQTMPPDIAELILSEIRSLRERFDEFSISSENRISTLESQMYTVVGNGQPGRLTKVESDVKRLDRWKYWVLGSGAGISTVVAVVWELFKQTHS
jgi:hypothetical protein